MLPSTDENSPMKVLLAEDSAVYRQLIGGQLKDWDFDLEIAKDGEEAWTFLQSSNPARLVLLDWILPKIEGVELCRRLRRRGTSSQYTYVVLLTAKNKQNDLLEGMQSGADDYLVKPFDPAELRARLLAGKRIIELQQELIDKRESLRVAATVDFLTRLLNRGEIIAFLEREIDRGRRQKTPLGVILADIDHFKTINDSFGHLAGDSVLKEVARRLKSELRTYDGAGRYGGEEFLMVLPGCDLSATLRRADQIRNSVSSKEPGSEKIAPCITISMGVTVGNYLEQPTAEGLLHEADEALYRAKKNGRNRVEAFFRNTHHPTQQN